MENKVYHVGQTGFMLPPNTDEVWVWLKESSGWEIGWYGSDNQCWDIGGKLRATYHILAWTEITRPKPLPLDNFNQFLKEKYKDNYEQYLIDKEK